VNGVFVQASNESKVFRGLTIYCARLCSLPLPIRARLWILTRHTWTTPSPRYSSFHNHHNHRHTSDNMSDANSPNVGVNSVDPKDNVPNAQTLLKLPPELIDQLAALIDSGPDILSLRATCCYLRDTTALQLCNHYLSPMKISGNSSMVRLLTTTLTSPHLPQAQRMAKTLVVHACEGR
jgi:hypothetical protein